MRLLCAVFLFSGPAFALGPGGSWRGTYTYDDGRPAVEFKLELCVEGNQARGSVLEANTFGADGSGVLRARVEGTAAGNELTFRKTYDGTGGASHSVDYDGTVGDGIIRGTWRIPPDTRGSFEATREAGGESDCGELGFSLRAR